ncbi:MAG: HAMP domain-containing sensor histidine kinase [Bacillota bacterium]|nr:HAMP domain-containing sensor histidine kinase [Bacillota bacterium]
MIVSMLICICILLACAFITTLVKVFLMKKAVIEICEGLEEKLKNDTNTLITISTSDKSMRRLAQKLNEQLKELREQRHYFVQGDAELKEAVTNISHDIRTPLTAICGYLELLEEEEMSKKAVGYLEIIKSRTEILENLTEELFQYSMITAVEEDMEREAVVVNSVLEESIAAFYTTLTEANISPRIEITEKRIVRKLSPSALSRIFSNLINNAVKYSDGDLEISLSEKGEIVFSNTASGLNYMQVSKLFERFYTVEDMQKSTGLGLSIVKKLVEQMDGRIIAEYRDKKLIISVYFPEL